jgi:hypothetical protein
MCAPNVLDSTAIFFVVIPQPCPSRTRLVLSPHAHTKA